MPTSLLIAIAFLAGVAATAAVVMARRSSVSLENRDRVAAMLAAAKRYSLGDLTHGLVRGEPLQPTRHGLHWYKD